MNNIFDLRYKVDCLQKNDMERYTINLEVRKEILKRLLELNHTKHEEGVKAGLWEKKGKVKGYKWIRKRVMRLRRMMVDSISYFKI